MKRKWHRLGKVIAVLAMTYATSAYAAQYDQLVQKDAPVLYLPMGHPAQGMEQDESGHHLEGKYYGNGAQATQLPNGDNATLFDGNGQYLEVTDNPVLSVPQTGILTIEAWMQPDVLDFPRHEGTNYVHWLGKGEQGQQEYAARIYCLTNEENRPNRISGYAFNLSGGLGAGSYFQDTIQGGEWIHYVLVINTKAVSPRYPTGYTALYKNGRLRDQDSLKGFNIIPRHGTAPLRIATRDKASFFAGAIGKIALYDYELPPSVIRAHYEAMTEGH